jgi:beta-propeller repeat-containing protein/ASPM-SPD-2-Hydin domain-containing protein/centrosomal CEP192-like protein
MPAGEMQRESPRVQASEASAKARPTQKTVAATLAALPLSFEANQGQAGQATRFLARGSGYTLQLASREAVLALRLPGHPGRKRNIPSDPSPFNRPSAKVTRSTALRMRLLGSNPTPHISGLDDLPGRTNYFIGNDPKKWRTNIPNYAKVRYESVYPGVDLVHYGNQGRLENDFIVAPGANPLTIRLGFQGARKISLDTLGELVLRIPRGEVRFQRPRAYQKAGATERPVAAAFLLKGRGKVGFSIGPYDQSKTLVIDPVLSYSTYLGGSSTDQGAGIAVDGSGDVYVTGFTQSADFPLLGTLPAPNNALQGSTDAFVTKLNPSGSALLYSTYLGGTNVDEGTGIAVDSAGNAYVTGFTQSTDFPLASPLPSPNNALQGSADAFVTKLNPAGSALVYSTYLGGSGVDQGTGIAVDSSGNAYVTGFTESSNFPVLNPLPAPNNVLQGLSDAFATKLSTTGSLAYSTYLGGSGSDQGNAIAVDGTGNAYVTGFTNSSANFPVTSGVFQTVLKGTFNAFVAKLNTTTTTSVPPVYCTYLGGSGTDEGFGVAIDGSGNAYVTGGTSSADFPSTNSLAAPNNALQGPSDAFVTKLNPTGTALLYSTYLGGTGSDQGNAIAVDVSGNAYVTGFTNSSNFPMASPVQNANGGGFDAFLTELAFSGSTLSLVYSTYLGGSGTDDGVGIAIDSLSLPNAYVTGFTQSADFPLLSPLRAPNNALQGFTDAFVAKISPANAPGVSLSKTSLTFASQSISTTSPAQTVVLRNVGSAALTFTSITASGDFTESGNDCLIGVAAASSCTISVTFSPTQRGTRTGAVTITDNAAGSPHTISLSGNGIAPAVTLSPGSLTFTNQNIGTASSPKPVTLTNSGVDPLAINGVVTSGDFAQTNACPTALAAGANCTISVSFTPTAALTRTGSLIIVDNAPNSPHTVQLSGTGVGPAATLSTLSLTFGEQPVGTTSGPQTVTLTNSGNAPMTISGFTVSVDFVQTNNCGGSLAAGNSCTLKVTFSPTSAGTTSGAITIADNAPGNPHVVALSGLSVAGPAAEVFLSPSNLPFGPQPVTLTTSAQALTLTNTGNAALTITNVTESGDFSQSSSTCRKQLGAGANCTINITFTPAAPGLRAGTLTVTDSATGSPHTAILSGTGTDFALLSAQPNATVNAGQTATYNLTVAPVSGFNQQVSLTCSGAPQAATCAITPAQVTLDGTNSQTVKAKVTTTARSLAPPRVQGPRVVLPPWGGPKSLRWILALLALGVLAAGMTPRLARRRVGLALVAILFVLLWGACVVGSQKINGTLPGSYPLTVTATAASGKASLTHTINLGLNVN